MKTRLPADAAINAEVDLCGAVGEYCLQVRLNISLPGVERKVAQASASAAHQMCPTPRHIDVAIKLV